MTDSQNHICECHKLDCTMELVLGENSNKKVNGQNLQGYFKHCVI